MGILTPETDTGGRTDADADFAGTIFDVLTARQRMQRAAEESVRPLGAMIAANTMPPGVLSELSVGAKHDR